MSLLGFRLNDRIAYASDKILCVPTGPSICCAPLNVIRLDLSSNTTVWLRLLRAPLKAISRAARPKRFRADCAFILSFRLGKKPVAVKTSVTVAGEQKTVQFPSTSLRSLACKPKVATG